VSENQQQQGRKEYMQHKKDQNSQGKKNQWRPKEKKGRGDHVFVTSVKKMG